MTFRKDSLLFYQSELFYIVMMAACMALIPILGLFPSLLFVLPFFVFILVNPKLHNAYITVNENGISCQKSGKTLWAYPWDSIAELRKGSRFLLPSIEVIAYQKSGEPEPFALDSHYFQLGKQAKDALKRYYQSGK